ncbi:hypothetical protein AeMF1_014140 [Aphanomyces euteiches]|nr:hypothetical protein AeMF1_014140 [Aphanomyces euteiches]
MGSQPRLTVEERASIATFRRFGLSFRAIAKELGRNKDTIRAYLKNPEQYGRKFQGRKLTKIIGRECRRLYREASNTGASARSLHSTLKLEGSMRTCQRRMLAAGFLKYLKRKGTPSLLPRHKIERINYASRNLEDQVNWTKIIWSDEKKFNLDGPDGLKYYWHDLRKAPESFFSRANGGQSVMVWGAFSGYGKSELAILEGNQDADDYIHTLGDHLFPFGHSAYGPNFVFMQDGASIHRVKTTIKFLNDQGVQLFDHPALSPDLNPIENVWGMMARKVYENGKHLPGLKSTKTISTS